MSDCLSGCLVVKHAWKGKYKRIMSVTNTHVNTYNPDTMELTNSWPIEDIVDAFIQGKPGQTTNMFSFVHLTGRGKSNKTLTFSTDNYLILLSDILRNRPKFFGFSKDRDVKTFNAQKMRCNMTTHSIALIVSSCALEQWSITLRKRVGIYFYKDISTIVYVKDVPNGFIVVHKHTLRKRCFVVNQRETLVNSMVEMSLKFLGESINISSEKQGIEYFITQKFGITNDSLWAFVEFPVYKVTPRSEDQVSRVFSLSEKCIIEHDTATYDVVTVKPYAEISKLIRLETTPQKFGIEYKSSKLEGVTYYYCAERDVLLSTLLDTIRLNCSPNIFVQSLQTAQEHKFWIPGKPVDVEVEMLHLKMLLQSEDKVEFIQRFNSNVLYNGMQYAQDNPDALFNSDKKHKMVIGAITSILNMDNFDKFSFEECEQYFQCLRRLFATKAGFESFTSVPKFLEILGRNVVKALLQSNDTVSYAAIEMLGCLLYPMHENNELYYETQNKLSIFSSEKFVMSILNVLKNHIEHGTGSLVIYAVLDFLTYGICPPFSETTDANQFVMLMECVYKIGRSFYKLFNHPSGAIVKSTGLIIQSMMKEARTEIVEHIQNNVLAEGILPKHLLSALYIEDSDVRQLTNRQLSRHLLSMWLHNSEYSEMLLKRILPIGLTSCLFSVQKAEKDQMTLERERDTLTVAMENAKVSEDLLGKVMHIGEKYLVHWRSKLYESLGRDSRKIDPNKKVVPLRNVKINFVVTENWDLFYQEFYKDHYLPDLIWNHKTREELKEHLEADIRAFSVDKELSGKDLISWNFDEFEVPYNCLENQLKIGKYYMEPLIENILIKSITEPFTFFNDVYHRFLQVIDNKLRIICLKGLTKLYHISHEEIGVFNDLAHMLNLLKNCLNREERDHLILFMRELIVNKENSRTIIAHNGISMIVDLLALSHLHTTRAIIPMHNNFLEGPLGLNDEFNAEWYVSAKAGSSFISKEAYTIGKIKKMYEEGIIKDQTKLWAQGMQGWAYLKDITQLKWSLTATGVAVMNDTDLSILVLDILIEICREYPSVDPDGGIVRPLPKIKRYISDIRCLPHICQLLLTFEPRIVERVCMLLHEVMIENPHLSQLFISGFFFFVMMYTGSNILPIARFIKYAHDKQSVTATEAKNYIAKLSILGNILPEALVCYLNNYNAEKFASVFLGNHENPEVIWSEEMRRFMIERISIHLADFIPKLKANVKTLYMYCPMPCIEYVQLSDELFCGNYYLSRLCDEKRFPNWPITEPLRVLRDILELWKLELAKKVPALSIDEANEALGLAKGEIHDDNVIRRSYLKLATKYHPDKNPDGKEIFDKVLRAYEFLCSKEARAKAPQISNLVLILRSQTILFKRCQKLLKPYKFSGYPMLIKALKDEVNRDDLFNRSRDDCILLYATELCHYTISCSILNAEELRREGGIEVLKCVLDRCVSIMCESSKATDIDVEICIHVLRCFTASSTFEGFRTIIFELPGYVQNLCNMLMFNVNLPELAATVVECIMSLSSDSMIQMRLLQMGIFYHLILFLFNYDYTLTESGVSSTNISSKQMQCNELACLSLQALSIIAGTALDFGSVNRACYTIISIFLTEFIAEKLSRSSVHEILKLININSETPQYIWNNNTRKQLIGFLDEIRFPDPEKERENYEKANNFVFDEHKDHLVISGIFVQCYNKLPSFELDNPKLFFARLLEYTNNQLELFMSMGVAKAVQDNDDLMSFEPVSNLDDKAGSFHDVLLAINNVINHNPGFELDCNKSWRTMFAILGFHEYPMLQKRTFEIIHKCVKNVKCVEAIESATVLGWFLPLISIFPDELDNLFECLDALLTRMGILKEALLKGILIYLLSIFVSNYDSTIRIRTASLFAKMISDKMSGPRVKISLAKFLPNIFLEAIMDDVEAAILLFESSHENPELIWNDEIRKHVSKSIAQLHIGFFLSQKNDPSYLMKVDDNFSCFTSTASTLSINGVYLHLLLKQPGWVLRRPKEFLIGLMDKIMEQHRKQTLSAYDNEILQTCTSTFYSYVTSQQLVAEYIPALGHLAVFADSLAKSIKENNLTLTGSCIKFYQAVTKNLNCCKALISNPSFLPNILASFKIRPDLAECAGEVICNLFSHKIGDWVYVVSRYKLLETFVSILGMHFVTDERNVTASTRAYIATAIQNMCDDLVMGATIELELKNFPLWNDFKNQKHDLFIEEAPLAAMIAGGSRGTAGYLTAAHNTTQNSAQATTSQLLLTFDKPPTPPDSDTE